MSVVGRAIFAIEADKANIKVFSITCGTQLSMETFSFCK